ncbi:hypothetical protein K493DRAFT_313393 [Basidiobolus meristosporus CBS 931.73]|uniref:DUF1279 domain-containing protein n=1 Tax=Basidiobolus meristosporus CBS 931.73 TaxID=1314790 RepID=A0A1Y1YLU7_9FUNG|nr:hypothetical protein K493DRAFT_313393 [Basidiobolus meristosporus CBS 931.73]|eukprot:ORX98972.1 hypothetical protein K493DRAFT_313393 [Basidiobolus meristosporus CBS 931.73]
MNSLTTARACLSRCSSGWKLYTKGLPCWQPKMRPTASTSPFELLSINYSRPPPLRLYSSSAAPAKKPSKMKELISKYGKTATVAYLGISAIDLSLTFWLVSTGGESFVKGLEDWLVENFGGWEFVKKGVKGEISPANDTAVGRPSLTSTFLIAYSIHKLLLPIRIPITAAVTPALARKFQQLGWTIFIKKP